MTVMGAVEQCWELISCVGRISLLGVTGALFSCFAAPFLAKRKYVWMAGMAYFLTTLMLYLIPYEMEGMTAYAIGMAAAVFVLYGVDRRNPEQKLFLAVMMYLVSWMSQGISLVFDGMLFTHLIETPYMAGRPFLQAGCYLLTQILYVLLRFLVMAFYIRVISRVYVCKKENMSRRELGLMLVTPFLALVGDGFFSFFSNAYFADTGWEIWQIYGWKYNWLQALYQIMSYLAVLTTIVFYQGIRENGRKEKERAILGEQMEHMKRYISEAEKHYAGIRGLKHDMANHVMTLEALVDKKEKQEALCYLESLKDKLFEMETELKTGNPVTDVILLERKREAREKGICFTCDFHYPMHTGIDVFDISVILNNALENALEAAQKSENPFIELVSYRRKNVYMLEFTNSFEGRLVLQKEDGLPRTTKAHGAAHGFGLANIRRVAQKYFGDIAVRQEEGKVILSVMLMLE